jgi:hypothetical protein
MTGVAHPWRATGGDKPALDTRPVKEKDGRSAGVFQATSRASKGEGAF